MGDTIVSFLPGCWPVFDVASIEKEHGPDSVTFPYLQNAEILILTYGSIVRQLVADYDDVDEVNKQLEKM